ncbi:MAG: HAD-IC family P-type ATPase, partial [Clostridiales bacterium]|nr:HAD-IC family P-type ATPase [Clostridiales bacterium]
MKFYDNDRDEVLNSLNTSPSGLSSTEARRRLEEGGPNKLKEAKKTPLIIRFLEQLKDPMIIILLVAAIVSGVVSVMTNESFADTIIIIVVVLLNATLGVIQESKAEKAIEALQAMSRAQSRVMRDGVIRVVKSEELVPGDIVLLEAGDAVPADGRIIECASLQIEEAALTGESVPVTKQSEALPAADKDVPLGDRVNMCYMGSTVAYGRGYAVITATGMDTEMGKIADALTKAEAGKTPLQKKLGQLSRILTYAVIGICIFMFAFSLLTAGKGNIDTAFVLDTFMIAVSLAVAAIPEGLATVVTISLSIGVTKMSKRNAVIRKLTAVETLGCTEIICSDKTGTLTLNRMTVVRTASIGDGMVDALNMSGDLSPSGKLLCTAMSLCSDAEPDENDVAVGEPTECALVNFATLVGLDKRKLKAQYPRIGEAPFDSARKLMTTVHSSGGDVIQFTKGAPDELLKRCTMYFDGEKAVPMTDDIRERILADNKAMADDALRALAAAMRTWDDRPASMTPSFLEQNLTFIGIVGMIDPVRPEAIEAVRQCRSAGIRPIMITGDHRDTAAAIAKQIGIITDSSEVLTGAELSEMSDEELDACIEKYGAYARVQPEHKVRIVTAWQKRGKVTAMTGDGVNDAAGIKSADIGVGMGITGTDVTKNVADMVLADDNFATIVSAVEEGRRIYDNIRKAIQFLLASNTSEVISIFFATLLG